MSEDEAVLQHVAARLAASGALAAHVGTRIYMGSAPQGATFPHLVYSLVTAADRGYIGRSTSGPPRPQFMSVDFQIDVWDDGRNIADILAAHEDAYAAVTVMGTQGGYHLSPCVRTLTLPRTQNLGGVTYNARTVLYTVNVSKLS